MGKSKSLREQEYRRLTVKSFAELQQCVERANKLQMCQDMGLWFEVVCRVENNSFMWKAFTDITMLQGDAAVPNRPTRSRIGLKAFLNILLKLELAGDRQNNTQHEEKEGAQRGGELREAVLSQVEGDGLDEEECCSICLEALPDTCMPCCKTSFCYRCLQEWSNANAAMAGCCPMCREPIHSDEAWDLVPIPNERDQVEDIQSTLEHFKAAARLRPGLGL